MGPRDKLQILGGSTPHMEQGRGGDPPRAIVLHTTDGSFAGTATWFGNPDSGVSAHFMVALDGRVAQFVDERDTARHAGRVRRPTAALAIGEEDLNRFTIGIEFEDGGDPTGVERTEAQYEAGGLLIADIATRWEIPLDRDHLIAHSEVFDEKECPGNLDVERLLGVARDRAAEAARRPLLACLLPIRNAEADLPGYLDSVKALEAPLIALDDGSADASAEILEASPLVATLLRNPRRSGYAEWDDAANRRRLLEAAADLDPHWVLFLDADERIDADDAQALRDFIAADALPGLAYGLQLFRTWGLLVERRPANVFRLFAFEPGQVLPGEQLHFNPVPDVIPRSAWVRTTIRVRHLDSPERAAARREKYRQADPSGRFQQLSQPLLDSPPGPLEEWKPRPPELPVLEAPAPAAGAIDSDVEQGGPTLVCLLPARNCARDLRGYFESVSRFVDAVIALDDGSTDGTLSALEAEPLVKSVIRNPVREGYAEWDDAANRQRLLEAAAALNPSWVLFLDADERIDADDAAALRDWLEHDADPREAYGFRVHRMVGDLDHYDRAELWVYRLFAFEPGQRLPEERLHLVPVPTSIPRGHWQQTTVRIQHLAGLTEERRLERLQKYEHADPELLWQREYRHALLDVGEPREWEPRPPGLEVLDDALAAAADMDLELLDLEGPVLSAIVISRNDEKTIERSIRSVVEQECPVAFEVIVVASGKDRTAEVVRERFPDVTLIELEGPALPGRARNAGLAVARGEYISFPGSHIELPPGSLAARVRAHEQGWAMVTGSMLNGTRTRAGWASYFLDHSSSLPGRPSEPLAAAPAACSYVREFLAQVGGFPEDVRAGEDTAVNNALWRAGHRAFREREIRLTHNNPCRSPARLVRHHFVRGRAYGRILRGDHRSDRPRRRPPRRFLTDYHRDRITATDFRVAQWGGELAAEYQRVRPLVILGALAAWAGLGFELARPLGARSAGSPPGKPRDGETAPTADPSRSG